MNKAAEIETLPGGGPLLGVHPGSTMGRGLLLKPPSTPGGWSNKHGQWTSSGTPAGYPALPGPALHSAARGSDRGGPQPGEQRGRVGEALVDGG